MKTIGPELKSLTDWLDSLSGKEREELLNLYKKEKEREKEKEQKFKVTKVRVKPGLRKQDNQIHPDIQKVLDRMATFQYHHHDIVEEWQKLERELKSERERIMAKWKVY
jgi:hypothetical protein